MTQSSIFHKFHIREMLQNIREVNLQYKVDHESDFLKLITSYNFLIDNQYANSEATIYLEKERNMKIINQAISIFEKLQEKIGIKFNFNFSSHLKISIHIKEKLIHEIDQEMCKISDLAFFTNLNTDLNLNSIKEEDPTLSKNLIIIIGGNGNIEGFKIEYLNSLTNEIYSHINNHFSKNEISECDSINYNVLIKQLINKMTDINFLRQTCNGDYIGTPSSNFSNESIENISSLENLSPLKGKDIGIFIDKDIDREIAIAKKKEKVNYKEEETGKEKGKEYPSDQDETDLPIEKIPPIKNINDFGKKIKKINLKNKNKAYHHLNTSEVILALKQWIQMRTSNPNKPSKCLKIRTFGGLEIKQKTLDSYLNLFKKVFMLQINYQKYLDFSIGLLQRKAINEWKAYKNSHGSNYNCLPFDCNFTFKKKEFFDWIKITL